MTPRDRYNAMVNFRRPDRPFIWTFDIRKATMDAWLRDGYPAGVPVRDLLGYDGFDGIPLVTSHWPAFEKVVVEEKDGHVTYYDEEGALRTDAVADQGSGFVTRTWLRFPVQGREDFLEMARERYNPEDLSRRRTGFDAAIARTRTSDRPCMFTIQGFYWTMRQWLGLENLSLAFYDAPELVDEMMDFILDFNVRLIRTHLGGAEVDNVMINEDMAYKTASMVSPAILRQKFVPRYRELAQEARRVCADKVFVDSDGHVGELIPLWREAGIDGTSPVEIAAEQDIVDLAERNPGFVFVGGIDKRALCRGLREVEDEVCNKARTLYARGGWIPAVDHAVPANASFASFRHMIDLLKKAW